MFRMNINKKKIISIILLLSLVLTTNGINTLASQSDVFNVKELSKEDINIEYDAEMEEKEDKGISSIISDDSTDNNQEEFSKEENKENKENKEALDFVLSQEDLPLSTDSNIEKNEEVEDDIATNSDVLMIDESDMEISTSSIVFGSIATDSDIIEETIINYGHLDTELIVPKREVEEKSIFGAPSFPAYYDARQEKNNFNMSIVPPVRNQSLSSQHRYGTCWAHSTIGMIETSIRKQNLVDNEQDSNLSEAALAYFYYDLENVTNQSDTEAPHVEGRDHNKINTNKSTSSWEVQGGNPQQASILMTTYMGAVTENDDTKYTNMPNIVTNGLDKKYAFNSNSFEIVDAKWINKDDRDLVKEAIMENGSAGISYLENRNTSNCFEKDGEWYYYSSVASRTNHDVMIVGWNDNISKETFTSSDGSHPSVDGGWLVRNSWGDDNDLATHGYFWISYEDQTIGKNIYSIKAAKADTYKYNYHYDTTGSLYYSALPQNYSVSNVFKVSDDFNQTLDAVSVVLFGPDLEFDIEVYTNDNEMNSPEDGTKRLAQKVNTVSAGIYTIKLNKKIKIKKGSYFSIILKNNYAKELLIMKDKTQIDQESDTFYYNEAALKQSYIGVISSGYYKDDNFDTKTNSSKLQNINGIEYGENYRIRALTNIDNSDSQKEYVLSSDWFDSSRARKTAKDITSITIAKYPNPAPTDEDVCYEIDGSNGLECYVKGTEITIYAPDEKPIYLAEDSSYLFSIKKYIQGTVDGIDLPNSFVKVSSLKGLNNLDTSKVQNMERMFAGLGYDNMYESTFTLKANPISLDLDVSTFDTKNVTNMSLLFEASAIKTIDLSNFDTSKVENMKWMFAQCGLLTTLDLSSFNTSALTSVEGMFEETISLTDIKLNSFVLKNVTDFSYMFANLKKITTLDISSFDTSNAIKMTEMFNGCDNLKTIIVSHSFNTDKVTDSDDMFNDCEKLIGGNNTTYDKNNVSKTYARIDGVNGLPGYFTGNNIVKVTFDLNGKGTNFTQIVEKGNKIVKPADPSYVGLSFSHWYEEGKSENIAYDFDVAIPTTAPSTIKLIAKWQPVTYTIEYNLMGVKATTPSAITKTYGVDLAIGELKNPTNIPSGYEFLGWYKESTYTTLWTGNEDLTMEKDATKYIYARWKRAVVYSVLLNGKDIGATLPPSQEITQETTINLPNTSAIGYIFDGWYKSDTDFSQSNRVGVASDPVKVNEPITFYAKWKEKEYSITYHNVDPSDGVSWQAGYVVPASRSYTEKVTLPTATNISKVKDSSEYLFEGWYENENFIGNSITEIPANTDANKEYWAKWVEEKYSIIYRIGAATGSILVDSNLPTTIKNRETLTIPEPQRIGYTFLGWEKNDFINNKYPTTEKYYKGSIEISGADITNKEITFVSMWQGEDYTLTIYVNGNGISKDNTDKLEFNLKHGESITLESSFFTSNDSKYYLLSYNSKQDGSGINYNLNQTYEDVIDEVADSTKTTLYCIWRLHSSTSNEPSARDERTGTSPGGGSVIAQQTQSNQQQNNNNPNRVDSYQVHLDVIKNAGFVLDPITNKMKISDQSLKAGFYNIDTGTGGSLYCIDENGNMKTGLVEYQGNIYYMDERQANLGRMFVGEVIIDNFKFVFDAFGRCVSGKENYQIVLQKQQQKVQQEQQAINIAQMANQTAQATAQQMAQQMALRAAMQFAQFSKENAWNSILNMIATRPFPIQ